LNEFDRSFKQYFRGHGKKNVRKLIKPGNAKSLWMAVNAAKDCAKNNIPGKLYQDGVEVDRGRVSDVFGSHFDTKIKSALDKISVRDGVYNKGRQVHSENKMFMLDSDIWECVKSLKAKNSEGMDRIPKGIVMDGKDILVKPLVGLLELIYSQSTVPDQWLIAKTIPVFKNKEDRSDISNYCLIANLFENI
jgi:hypothetical protein